MMTSRWATGTRRGYVGWLELVVAHEYFHAWNVKRLRPVELGPFDYENESVRREALDRRRLYRLLRACSRSKRAGLATQPEYLGTDTPLRLGPLSGTIASFAIDARTLWLQSAEQASLDAWIKFYRPDENTNQQHDQLLHEGRDRRLAPRCADTAGHKRGKVARRSYAAGV